ncbi:MAG TPA: hypothetical protein VK480_09505 [Solirubrobacterales bacterium]|nr:hypothetical protein [Solirubrobacterales bacterium]
MKADRDSFAEELREMEKELDQFDATCRSLERAMIEAETAWKLASASRRRYEVHPWPV